MQPGRVGHVSQPRDKRLVDHDERGDADNHFPFREVPRLDHAGVVIRHLQPRKAADRTEEAGANVDDLLFAL